MKTFFHILSLFRKALIQICVLELHQVWEAPKLEAKITVHHFREKVLDFHKILKMACHPKG